MAINRLSLINSSAKSPLAVHIVLDQYPPRGGAPGVEEQTARFAYNLWNRLSSGDRSPKVPVRLWRGHQLNSGKYLTPLQIPLGDASKNVIVLLVDQPFFEKRAEWKQYITALSGQAKREKNVILPIAIRADAARVASELGDVNHIIVRNPASFSDDERVFQAIYTALLRLLNKLPHIFMCHAKSDGNKIARKIRQYLYEETQLNSFFDIHDIPHGEPVTQSIVDSIKDSFVFVVWTDRLLDSPWCQFEIIEARANQRPMLILDALTKQASRVFPFFGNMPIVRWANNPSAVVSALLLELIRADHLSDVFKGLSAQEQPAPNFGLHPPDLLETSLAHPTKSSSGGQSQQLFVYPDPPLKGLELETLKRTIPLNRFWSLTEWRALRAAGALWSNWEEKTEQRPSPLRNMKVGISVSESDTWADLGLIQSHQDDLASDLALELILLGAKILWGGDLRPEGLGDRLRWIVQTYQHPSHPPQDHVKLFAPYSLSPEMALSAQAIEARRAFADVVVPSCPIKLPERGDEMPGANSAKGRALTALALSIMREEMAKECDARILLGGRLHGFQGLYPGIAEEAFETIRIGRPLYILGGFGGAAKAIYEIITSSRPANGEELVSICHKSGAGAVQEIKDEHEKYVRLLGRSELAFNPEAMVEKFSKLNVDGLSKCNCLSPDENKRLAESQDLYEILELVVKGLVAIAKKFGSK